MSKEGSIAPKERVNIVYKPAGEGAAEVELPLKILAIGDYTGKPDDRQLEDRKPISIDKDNFEDVMAQQALGVDLSVADKMSNNDDAELSVALKFQSMKDFTPEGVLHQVPELQKLMELRNALTALKSPLGNRPAFRRRLQQLLENPDSRQRLLDELKLDKQRSDPESPNLPPKD